jgi:demethylmenaquinone methyltransferase/2-methoxy-6-polyprenyl-1,4-benzoquinol methylase
LNDGDAAMTEVDQTRAFYDRIAHAYDLISDSSEHTAREAGERALGGATGETVLEIGPGTGHSLLAFARAVGDSGRVIGVDLSARMLEQARARLEAEGVADRVDLRCEDARGLSLEDASVDAAFLSFTLELFEADDQAAVLAELRRVLRPARRLVVVAMALPSDGEHEGLLERAYVWMHRHFPHIVDCRPIDVVAVLERSAFRVTANETLSIWTMPVSVVTGRV